MGTVSFHKKNNENNVWQSESVKNTDEKKTKNNILKSEEKRCVKILTSDSHTSILTSDSDSGISFKLCCTSHYRISITNLNM